MDPSEPALLILRISFWVYSFSHVILLGFCPVDVRMNLHRNSTVVLTEKYRLQLSDQPQLLPKSFFESVMYLFLVLLLRNLCRAQ